MTITLTINDKEVQAEPGMTVLETARANDIFIPTLCYAPNLAAVGACRMCVVEIEKMRGFPTACTVPATDGMVVRTESDALKNLRQETLALILSEHPYTCLVCSDTCGVYHAGTIRKAAVTTGCQYCPANGQCTLQDLVDYLEMEDMPYPISYRGLPVETEDPFFDRDYNLCILCGRCVRVCQEVRHAGVLAFIERGNQTIVSTAFGQSHLETNCQFCGACVDTCPTGALADKRGKWEGKPDAFVPGICPHCSVGCQVNIQVKNGKVIRATARENGPVNDGQICVRGRFGMVDVIHNLARLKSPLVRRGDRLVDVSWSEALQEAGDKLSQYRGDQFAAIGSAQATNEESYLLQKFARTVMGSHNVALSAGFPEGETEMDLINTLKDINGPTIQEMRQADCILVIGANLFESHPILGLEIRHALAAKKTIITIDTRQTDLAQKSKLWLQPRVGSDHLLLAGIINALVQAGQISLEADLPDLSHVTERTGVSQKQIEEAAGQLARHLEGRTVILYGSGVTHHPTAIETINAIRSLAFVVGEAGVIGVPGEGNFVGAHDMGLHPALLPGYRPVAEDRAEVEAAWGVELNATPGQSYTDIIEGIRSGQIKALYLAGEIPPLPELAELECLIVQDIVQTEKIEHADVVLPAASFAEMEGTITNLEGRVQELRSAIAPLGLAQPGWKIITDLARMMGHEAWAYPSATDVMAEIGQLIPAYAELGLRRFDPAPQAAYVPFSLDSIPQIATDDYPLTLITERNLLYHHGVCLTEEVAGMNLIKREEILYLSQADAEQLGVADGSLVRVVSSYGSMECIAQVGNGMMPEGAAFASFNRESGSPLFPALAPTAKAWAIRVEVDS